MPRIWSTATQATAEQFELMGSHDNHPMFSGLFMQQLGYYSAANIHEMQWDRNPFPQEFDVVAHGASVDGAANRYNLVRIKVSPGLDYYVEVRQRPPGGSCPGLRHQHPDSRPARAATAV